MFLLINDSEAENLRAVIKHHPAFQIPPEIDNHPGCLLLANTFNHQHPSDRWNMTSSPVHADPSGQLARIFSLVKYAIQVQAVARFPGLDS